MALKDEIPPCTFCHGEIKIYRLDREFGDPQYRWECTGCGICSTRLFTGRCNSRLALRDIQRTMKK